MLMWPVSTADVFDEWFQVLDEEERAEIEAKVNLLEMFGPALGRPHADTLNGSRFTNMKELRADVADHAQLIAKADVLYAEHLGTIENTKKKRGGK